MSKNCPSWLPSSRFGHFQETQLVNTGVGMFAFEGILRMVIESNVAERTMVDTKDNEACSRVENAQGACRLDLDNHNYH